QSVLSVGGLVDRVEDRLGPDQHVGEHRADEADEDQVAECAPPGKPSRLRQGPDEAQPQQRAEPEHAGVLERVNEVVADGELVEERQVPGIEVGRPQNQGDERVGKYAKGTRHTYVEEWLDDGPGQAE